jgi:cytochrome bd-type quinol oxidase subunit 2
MAENGRPAIKPKWSFFEKILQIISPLILIGIVIQLATVWNTLPWTIPTHFNAAGAADGWGGKGVLFGLPITALFFYVLLTIVERFPKIYNFSFEITEKNAPYAYQTGREMLVCAKAFFLLIFGYLQWSWVEAASGRNAGPGLWLLPVILVLTAGIVIYYIRRMAKHKNGN